MVLLGLPLSAIAGGNQTVGASRVVDAARSELQARIRATDGSAELTLVGAPEDIIVGPGEASLRTRPISGPWPRSRIGVPVDVLVDGRLQRSATVWFALSVMRTVPAYALDYPLGTSSGEVHASPAEVNVAAFGAQSTVQPADMAGMRLRHAVRQGMPMLSADFEPVPEVDSHQEVKVLATFGRIELAAKGVADGVGRLGDVVSVMIDGAERPVRARVMEKGVVEVVQ